MGKKEHSLKSRRALRTVRPFADESPETAATSVSLRGFSGESTGNYKLRLFNAKGKTGSDESAGKHTGAMGACRVLRHRKIQRKKRNERQDEGRREAEREREKYDLKRSRRAGKHLPRAKQLPRRAGKYLPCITTISRGTNGRGVPEREKACSFSNVS